MVFQLKAYMSALVLHGGSLFSRYFPMHPFSRGLVFKVSEKGSEQHISLENVIFSVQRCWAGVWLEDLIFQRSGDP